MTKTGWPPPALMQDDNPQLSQWFATRPDALYTFKRNQMKSIEYTYYTDPGHGWLGVNYDELVELGIHKEVSGYSYRRGDAVYLEEDCDMALFINTMEAKGIKVTLKHINEPHKDSFIRSMGRYATYAMG
jgi:hypothetical protein